MGLFGDKGGLFGAAKFGAGDGLKRAWAGDDIRRKLAAIDVAGPSPPLFAAGGFGPFEAELSHADPIADFEPKRRRSLPERILGGLGRAFSGPDFGTRLAMAQAIAGGDTSTAARLSLELADARRLRGRDRELAARRQSAFNNLVKQGVSPGDAELALLDPETLGAAFNDRFRSGELPRSRRSDGLDGGGPGFEPGGELADPSQSDPAGDSEGAMAVGRDGRLYVVRNGQWVPAP